ncbi:MAG: hypothetical protein KC457_08955, partial [Myxococcales bacterium]|nr:hypothetical protein [Myxococcales bacterium]
AVWRESTVVLLQTSEEEALSTLLHEAGALLREANELASGGALDHSAGFDWPPSARHVCSILQDGLRARRELVPDDIRESADALIESVYADGTHLDHKWALEVVGACSNECVSKILARAFDSGSVLLADAAFWQVHELAEIPAAVSTSVSSRLVAWAESGVLTRERHKLGAYVARTSNARDWGAAIQILARMRAVMATLNLGLLAVGILFKGFSSAWVLAAMLTVFALLMPWHPLGMVCRFASVFTWFAIVGPDDSMWWMWMSAVVLALSWDLVARIVVRFDISSFWLFRLCPWLVIPMFGAILISVIEMRALGKVLLQIAAVIVGAVVAMFALIGLGMSLGWIGTVMSDRMPRLLYALGVGMEVLLYGGGAVLMLLVGVLIAVMVWILLNRYLRFVRAHRIARRGDIDSVEMLRELLADAYDDEHRAKLISVVRERRSLPAAQEVIVGLRIFEREVSTAGPEVQDAFARLAESLIDRRHGAACATP